MITKSNMRLTAGTRVKGKWHGEQYIVEQWLGEGANGVVYLVRKAKQKFALKLGLDTVDLQSEINVLRTLRSNGDPYLWDTDDFVIGGTIYPFYVMRYVEGVHLPEYVNNHGTDWLFIIIRRILSQLAVMHQKGWIFGDIKPENILIARSGATELIDFGGVSQIGASVKQFTELFDRGFWNAGGRRADPSYDLFSLAVMVLHLADRQKRIQVASSWIPQHRSLSYLQEMTDSISELKPIAPFIHKSLEEQYPSASEALAEYRSLLSEWKGNMIGKPVRLKWLPMAFFSTLTVFAAALLLFYYR